MPYDFPPDIYSANLAACHSPGQSTHLEKVWVPAKGQGMQGAQQTLLVVVAQREGSSTCKVESKDHA